MKTHDVPTLDDRCAGILLHPTSLPGPHGCGTMGAPARRFMDFLAHAGQRWWQLLPIGPVGHGASPYSETSSFAGNPLLIDPDQLVDRGLIEPWEIVTHADPDPTRARFNEARRSRLGTLERAFLRSEIATAPIGDAPDRPDRIDDYALYQAIKREHRGTPWFLWPPELAHRDPAALDAARQRLDRSIGFERFIQSVFESQWTTLRNDAHARGIGIIGDLPFFVPHDSCDVWSRQDLFELDEHGLPVTVSGAPPDTYNPDGQIWGHPLYAWHAHESENFSWWSERFRRALERFDALRIDHFLGLHRCWSIPRDAHDARRGTWIPTPGHALLGALEAEHGLSAVIAEDLGSVTQEAVRLRDRSAIPGMRVLQFGFTPGGAEHDPRAYPSRCVAYTGTHDNETITGWIRGSAGDHRAPDGSTIRERVLRDSGSDGRRVHLDLIRMLYESRANTVIVPLQDILGLDNTARMNRPGSASGNWAWRVERGSLTSELADTIRTMTEATDRTGDRRCA